ncbi:hypothetical protein FOMPIDRAFT_1045082 [Fomitopsis schrenkii]|uniref:Uncharacterized protein n=1 Tax=Fomitopsis schrenkii TaxID=2126942 RepID=S8FXE2_FOMSC|nr:hypothetical protein FOMPIDRAFT_1045082 [Fomitopsis schrenkii]
MSSALGVPEHETSARKISVGYRPIYAADSRRQPALLSRQLESLTKADAEAGHPHADVSRVPLSAYQRMAFGFSSCRSRNDGGPLFVSPASLGGDEGVCFELTTAMTTGLTFTRQLAPPHCQYSIQIRSYLRERDRLLN